MATSIVRAWHRISDIDDRYGLRAALQWTAARLADRLFRLEAAEVVWLEVEKLAEKPMTESAFEFRFLTADEVARFSADDANHLDAEFIRRVVAGHDLCFAAMDGARLAAYGWYALGSVEARHNFGVPLSYPSSVAYMYKGFTHPDYRGHRLHGLGMGLALRGLAAHGVSRLVSTVESTNWASLHSCDRLGYERLGRLWTIRLGSQRCSVSPRAARARQLRFGKRADVIER
jgi:L-amino acid N-acyltransferase YncA